MRTFIEATKNFRLEASVCLASFSDSFENLSRSITQGKHSVEQLNETYSHIHQMTLPLQETEQGNRRNGTLDRQQAFGNLTKRKRWQ